MPKIQLTKEELLYLSALKGVDNLWGVEDPFRGMSEDIIKSELLELQDSLIRKSCLDAAVDGRFSVASHYSNLINACMQSTRVYILSSSQFEEEQTALRYFVSDDSIVRYQFREYASIEFVSRSLMNAEIADFFGENYNNQEDSCSLITGIARLKRMGSLSKQRFLQELKACGCEDSLAILISDGLQGNPDFRSLLAYERTENSEMLCGKLVTISFAGGSLMVTPEGKNIDSVCFTKLNRDRLLSALGVIIDGREEINII